MTFEAVMDILHKDTGSHFDPGVMAVFTPIAQQIYDRFSNIAEAQTRQLLEERVRRHFDA